MSTNLKTRDQRDTARLMVNIIEMQAITFGAGISFEHLRMVTTVLNGIDLSSRLVHEIGYSASAVSRCFRKMEEQGFFKIVDVGNHEGGRQAVPTAQLLAYLDNLTSVLNGTVILPSANPKQTKYTKGNKQY